MALLFENFLKKIIGYWMMSNQRNKRFSHISPTSQQQSRQAVLKAKYQQASNCLQARKGSIKKW
jgi:hypothetical protein